MAETAFARARTIDLHAHAVLDSTFGAAGAHGPELTVDGAGVATFRIGNYRMRGVRYVGSAFMDLDLRIRRMDEAGIDFQVIGPNPLTYFHFIETPAAIRFCRASNDATAAAIARHPDRLAGLAALPVQDSGAAVEELHRAVTALGLWGAQIGSDSPNPLDSLHFDPIYRACTTLGVPLFIHPANAGIDGPPGDPALTRFDLGITIGYAGQEVAALATLVFGLVHERHPDLQIWISHGGGSTAFLAGRLAQAARLRPWAPASLRPDGAFETALRRFWFDGHLNDEGALAMLTRLVGEDRITFGTNFAGWDQPGAAHVAHTPAAWADNARRLFGRQ
jgi:aminocarboxymuconate-semialdehyde decarboxylase